jgi:DNA repair exonuclease SbcCD ATPase subunit
MSEGTETPASPHPSAWVPTPTHLRLEKAAKSADESMRAVVLGFRDVLFQRGDRHADSLTRAYEDAAAALQKSIEKEAARIGREFKRFGDEVVTGLEEKRASLEHDTRQITNDINNLHTEVKKRTQELKTATEEWENQHKRTFQGLDKFQKEYRDMIAQLDATSARMEKVVEGTRHPSVMSVLSIFIASVLGSALAVFLVLHA